MYICYPLNENWAHPEIIKSWYLPLPCCSANSKLSIVQYIARCPSQQLNIPHVVPDTVRYTACCPSQQFSILHVVPGNSSVYWMLSLTTVQYTTCPSQQFSILNVVPQFGMFPSQQSTPTVLVFMAWRAVLLVAGCGVGGGMWMYFQCHDYYLVPVSPVEPHNE